MLMTSFPLTLGFHVFKESLKIKIRGIKRYQGNADDICKQVVHDCWNGRFFQTSTTHFPQFWTRDFGWCTESLLKLGYKDKVEKTIIYALCAFSKHKKVTTTISKKDKPFDFPTYAVDSLPWLTHSLVLNKNKEIIENNSIFLEKEVKKFFEIVVDKKSGLANPIHFSSMKDLAVRKSSCYDNCMISLLSSNLKKLKLENPLKEFNHKKIIKENFWNGSFFYDDLSKGKYVAGDANIFPFYLKIINNKKMLQSAITHIHESRLDFPIPIKYTTKNAPIKFIWSEIFLHNYERDSIWAHMGPLYIKILKKTNKEDAEKAKAAYTKTIETYKNYLEVFNSYGKPFTTPFYRSDEGMLWAANYLTL